MGIFKHISWEQFTALMSLAWFLAGLLIGMRLRGGRRSSGGGNGGSAGGGKVNSTEIYVGNLPANASESDIRKTFERFGQVKDVRQVTSRADGGNRTFAFLSMGSVAEAQAAVDGMNGRDLAGSKITVSEARSRRRRGGRR